MSDTTAIELPSVLCVDDEPRVVESLAVHLRRNYRVLTANSSLGALQILKDTGAPAVIVSDMRMPGMDGASLLKQVKQLYPETTRILLTGDPGRDAAIAAVNDGQIFRYLTKPCLPDHFRMAIEAGVTQHRLISAEKRLLQETVVGCIQALVDVLAMTNPVAFGRASRVKRLAADLATAGGMQGFWQLQAAAMLSQIGFISLPVELVEKVYYGKRLTADERTLADGTLQVAQKLLERIPRLEPVIEILTASREGSAVPAEGLIKAGGLILRLVLDYDAYMAQGHSSASALRLLRQQMAKYGPQHVNDLERLVGSGAATEQIIEVQVSLLNAGMVFMDDLRTNVGALLVPKGFEVTEAFLQRVRNFGAAILQEKVRVSLAAKRPG
jgi:response regulator RpfG family c-di-GMP phosphodiesterase